MNPRLHLCAHLRDGQLAPIAPDDVLDWDDGAVNALARCARCEGLGLLELLDWSASRRVRVYALAALEPEALAVYRRNVSTGSCDLARAQREREALFAAAGAPEALVAIDAQSGAVVAASAWPAGLTLPAAPWDERARATRGSIWFAPLGLDPAD